MSLSEDWISSI